MAKQGFIVLQELANGQQQPVFRGEDERLLFFLSHMGAYMEICDAVRSIAEAIEEGHMDEDSRLEKQDYTITAATMDGDTITVETKDGTYQMLITQEDWHRVA